MSIEWKKLAFEADVIAKALLTAKGSIIYASDVGTPAELLIGDDGQFLSVATDVPEWKTVGGDLPFYTETGSLDVIPLNSDYELPFYDALAAEKNIPVTT